MLSKSRTLLVTIALATAALAGCIDLTASDDAGRAVSAALSEVRFEALPAESLWIPASSDGTQLHVVLFRPDTASDPAWKAPTIIVMTPYNGHDNRDDALDPTTVALPANYTWLMEDLVPRGYAVAIADVRGTGESGGCLEQTAPFQAQDGYDTVEYFAAQPWSNGRVGMWGKSYAAEAQQATATLAPPHLVTIVPVSSVSGQYEYSLYDGVPYTTWSFMSNFFYMQSDGLQTPTTPGGATQYPTRAGCHPGMMAQSLDMSGDWNEFWEVREIRKGAANVKASVLYVHGLQDWNVKPVAIRDWFDRIPSEKRAIFGQWEHDFPNYNRHEPEWSRQDWNTIAHRWFDYWLLGLQNGILEELPPVEVQDDAGAWRREAAFPPRDAQAYAFHLGAGTLTREAPAAFDPLPLRENEEAFARANTGLPVQDADTGSLQTALVFESEPLPADLRFSGWPTLDFTFKLDNALQPNTQSLDPHFAAILYKVAPDGTETWVNRGYLSARHREGVENPKPTPFNEDIRYSLRMFPQDTIVPAGHALKLVLSGSDDWTQPEGSFWAGVLSEGTLTLPVVERDLTSVGLDAPLGPPIEP